MVLLFLEILRVASTGAENKFDPFSCFGTIPTCDGRMDTGSHSRHTRLKRKERHADTHTYGAYIGGVLLSLCYALSP